MEPLQDYLTHTLCWVQPTALTRTYQLHAGGADSATILAVLRFETPFGSLATGQTRNGCWSFKRVGFFRPAVTIRPKGQDENVAVYQPRWTGTEGDISTGRGVYTFKTANFWVTRYEIRNPEDQVIITYESNCGGLSLSNLFKNQSTVTVSKTGRADPLIDLMVVVGWYLVILNRDDSAAVVATVAAATST